MGYLGGTQSWRSGVNAASDSAKSAGAASSSVFSVPFQRLRKPYSDKTATISTISRWEK